MNKLGLKEKYDIFTLKPLSSQIILSENALDFFTEEGINILDPWALTFYEVLINKYIIMRIKELCIAGILSLCFSSTNAQMNLVKDILPGLESGIFRVYHDEPLDGKIIFTASSVRLRN